MAVTHDIRGAAFPVNMWTGVYCTVQANMSTEICNTACKGGAVSYKCCDTSVYVCV